MSSPLLSIGAEETFDRDTSDLPRLRRTLLAQADRVASCEPSAWPDAP